MKLTSTAKVDGALMVLESSKILSSCQIRVDLYFHCSSFADGTSVTLNLLLEFTPNEATCDFLESVQG